MKLKVLSLIVFGIITICLCVTNYIDEDNEIENNEIENNRPCISQIDKNYPSSLPIPTSIKNLRICE